MHKMPYKHIAAHLQKTELACRLHYHQLSFGTKRRRRTLSVSSMKSVYQSQQQSHPVPLRASVSSLSPPNSPKSDSQHHSRTSSVFEPINILPKPSSMTSQQPLRSHRQSLRLITQDVDHFKERTLVDPHRLNRIYEAHRCHFWAMVAQDYGGEVSPAMLEEAWVASLRNPLAYPLTPPNRSPQSEKNLPTTPLTSALGITMDERLGQGFRPVNFARSSSASSAQRKTSFAISSILNEEEEAPRCSPVQE